MENAEQKSRETSMIALSAALGVLLCLAAGTANADTYTLPHDATSAPFNCTLASGTSYTCNSISLDKDTVINFTGPVTLNVAGNFTASKALDTSGNAYAFKLKVTGNVSLQKDFIFIGNISAGGNVSFDKDAEVIGDIWAGGNVSLDKDAVITGNISAGGNISIDKDSQITGNVIAGGNLSVDRGSVITGNCSYSSTNYNCTPPDTSLHHVRLNHSGSGVTCTGSPVTVNACNGADSGGTCTANTNGLSGFVDASSTAGTLLVSRPFTIAAGNSTVTVIVPVTSPQTATFATRDLSRAPGAVRTCWNGSAASCSHVYNDSGFLFDVLNHRSDELQTISVKAVKKSDSSLACVPAFSSTTQSVVFGCSYTNPATGTLPVRVGDIALKTGTNTTPTTTCSDPGGHAVSLSFDATGAASTKVQYADAGQVSLSASYSGLNMTGSDDFIAAPKKFAFSAPPAAPIKAGVDFSAKITALNGSGAATLNFGLESTPQIPTISFTRCQPAGGADGTFSGSWSNFSDGAATADNLKWNEVGNGDLSATLVNPSGYLSSGLAVTGNTGTSGMSCNGAGNVGRFIPDHFDTVATQPSTFTYSGQPFTVMVTARSAGGTATANYNSAAGVSKQVTLSAWDSTAASINPGPGALSPPDILPAAFSSPSTGSATGTQVYMFTSANTAPAVIRLRATDTDLVSSASGTEGTAVIRSGRLRLSNAFGNARTNLNIPVRAEYWTGKSWLLNSDDSFSLIPSAAVALNPAGVIGSSVQANLTLTGGQGNLVLIKPTSGTGSVDLAVNLGIGPLDQSCLGTHPPTTGAALPWLRSQNGNCAATFDRDPSARANFGIYAPETKKVIHIRELFN